MKYIIKRRWKNAERNGDFSTAAKSLLDEMNYNCKQIPHSSPKADTLKEFLNRFSYIYNMSTVPESVFNELKDARKDVKDFISKL